jgi:DNA ligase-4
MLQPLKVLLHKHGDTYMFHSRKPHEWTKTYGGHPAEGSWTQYSHKQFRPDADDLILDGEMMTWDSIKGRYISMGEEGSKVRHIGLEVDGEGEVVKDEFG